MKLEDYLGKKCPYCHMAFTKDDQIVVCGTCEMPHHLSCWQENNGCTTFGCTGLIKEFVGKNASPASAEVKPQTASVSPKGANISSDPNNSNSRKFDRFETLFHIAPHSIQKNSSVMVEEVSLLIDHANNAIAARCSFRCLTDKPIIAMMVDVKCSDIWGNDAQPVLGFQFLDLKTKRNASFGQNTPINISDTNTRSVDVVIKKILYADKSFDECGEVIAAFPSLQTLEDYYSNTEVAAQYIRETTSKAKYVSVENGANWMCSCGAINTIEDSVCKYCGIEKEKYMSLLFDGELATRAKAFVQEQAEKQERERREQEERIRLAEEQVKREQEAKEAEIKAAENKERRKKKKKKKRLFFLSF